MQGPTQDNAYHDCVCNYDMGNLSSVTSNEKRFISFKYKVKCSETLLSKKLRATPEISHQVIGTAGERESRNRTIHR